MNDFKTELIRLLSGKDGPLIWGMTAITMLTLGWKFFDSNYRLDGNRWQLHSSDERCNNIEKPEAVLDCPAIETE